LSSENSLLLGTSDWHCHYVRGRCSYGCCTKQDRENVCLNGELVGTIDINDVLYELRKVL